MGFNSQLTMVGLKPAYGKSSKNNKKIAYLSKCPLFSRSPFLQPQLSDFVSHWNDNCPRNVPISSRHTHTTTQVQFQRCIFLYFLKKTSTKLDLFSTISKNKISPLSLITPFLSSPFYIPHPAPPATHASFLSTNHWPPAPSNTNQAETFLQPCAKRSKPLLTTLQPKSYLPR